MNRVPRHECRARTGWGKCRRAALSLAQKEVATVDRATLAPAIKFLAGIIRRACPVMPYLPDMERKTANIDIRVEPRLVENIDAWRSRQRVLPSLWLLHRVAAKVGALGS
jgi:hypothetical protein